MIVLQWFPLTTATPFEKYLSPAIFYLTAWGTLSYLAGRYQPLRTQKTPRAFFVLLNISVLLYIILQLVMITQFNNHYSQNILLIFTGGEVILNCIVLSVYFSFRHAIEYEERTNAEVLQTIENHHFHVNQENIEDAFKIIRKHAGENCLHCIKSNVKIESGYTVVFSSGFNKSLDTLQNKQYKTLIQLERLNYVKGINKMFISANKVLENDGIFVCCFETKSTYKKQRLSKNIPFLRYLVYSFDFIFKRIFPKLTITRWFYYVFSGCRNRVLSKAEVLGRLYACGFEVDYEKKINHLNYVFARRVKQPEINKRRSYGPLIKLKRFGKNGKMFEVYKMRTMHPYSEFLQSYIFEKNSLKEGGKFNKDIRITTLGKFMRKYWLDELPMIMNLLKGEMKLVGVRPLSTQYFNLYSPELQNMRTRFKPGLLPPFYADMPKTLDEIQMSEMKYLKMCEEKSVISTDLHYLAIILKNIFINKARSA